MSRRYKLRFLVEGGDFTEEECKKFSALGCDAILTVAFYKLPNGEVKLAMESRDGATGERLHPTEYWHVFHLLAGKISGLDSLQHWQRNAAAKVLEYVQRRGQTG